MTTLVALSTKNAVVMGCDSLGTVNRPLVDPFSLSDYFDFSDEGRLKLDSAGEPFLKNFLDVFKNSEYVPYDHMSHVDKLVALDPLPVGAMFTGITSLGNRTVKSLLSEFREEDPAFSESKPNYTIKTLGQRLSEHISGYYEKELGRSRFRPELEILLAGYGRNDRLPNIYRLTFPGASMEPPLQDFGIAFGGQTAEIQRLVFGTDLYNKMTLEKKHSDLLIQYAETVAETLPAGTSLPDPVDFVQAAPLFEFNDHEDSESSPWGLRGMNANWGDYSEQNAIDCVSFFIKVMISAQRFNSAMPTVGGDIHIGLITRENGFQFISREEYRHEQNRVPRSIRRGR